MPEERTDRYTPAALVCYPETVVYDTNEEDSGGNLFTDGEDTLA